MINQDADNPYGWANQSIQRLHTSETIKLIDLIKGKPTLIVNTASHCGFTPQFEGLEKLYQQYKEKGLIVVGVPSNSFKQESENTAKTHEVCYQNFGVSFVMTETLEVKGKNAHPIFQHLNKEKGAPRWNFYKYLINRDGHVVRKFSSITSPTKKRFLRAIDQII